MSICPYCKTRVLTGSANKQKRQGVWEHKKCPKFEEKKKLTKVKGGMIK